MKFFLLGVGLLSLSVSAAVVITHQDGKFTQAGIEYDSADACATAATQDLGADPRTCEQVNRVIITGNCLDAPKPQLLNSERELRAVQSTSDDNMWWNYERAWVPADFPTCWVKGWEPEKYPAIDPMPGEYWTPPVDAGGLLDPSGKPVN